MPLQKNKDEEEIIVPGWAVGVVVFGLAGAAIGLWSCKLLTEGEYDILAIPCALVGMYVGYKWKRV